MLPIIIKYLLPHQLAPATVTDSVIGSWRMIGPRYVIEPDDGSFSDNNGGYVTIVRMGPANTNKLFAGFQLGGCG